MNTNTNIIHEYIYCLNEIAINEEYKNNNYNKIIIKDDVKYVPIISSFFIDTNKE